VPNSPTPRRQTCGRPGRHTCGGAPSSAPAQVFGRVSSAFTVECRSTGRAAVQARWPPRACSSSKQDTHQKHLQHLPRAGSSSDILRLPSARTRRGSEFRDLGSSTVILTAAWTTPAAALSVEMVAPPVATSAASSTGTVPTDKPSPFPSLNPGGTDRRLGVGVGGRPRHRGRACNGGRKGILVLHITLPYRLQHGLEGAPRSGRGGRRNHGEGEPGRRAEEAAQAP
jgi:hypothetical protein